MKQKPKIKFANKDRSKFFSILRSNVDAYFVEKNISKYANGSMVFKTVFMIFLYIAPLASLMVFHQETWQLVISFSIVGLAMAGIGMNVMHDANHNAYSANPLVNKLVGYSLNMVGGTVFNWKLQHNILHHTYTNVYEMDDDIDDKLVFRFSPHSQLRKFHRFQHIYIFLFYSIMSLYWVTFKDLIQLIKYNKNGVSRATPKEYWKNAGILFVSKTIYLFYMFFVPIYFFDYSFGQIFLGFLCLHIVCGLLLSVVFQLAHSVEEASHPIQNDKSEIENDWAIHQMNTTVNFARHNKFITWYVGGLNYQVEHHLFPNICHIHYPNIAEIVKRTAEEFEVPYLESPTFWVAFRSHINALKALGSKKDVNFALHFDN
jgi:linoleoyl-CoA desaturase